MIAADRRPTPCEDDDRRSTLLVELPVPDNSPDEPLELDGPAASAASLGEEMPPPDEPVLADAA